MTMSRNLKGCSKYITACTENTESCCHILKAMDDTFDTGNVSYIHFYEMTLHLRNFLSWMWSRGNLEWSQYGLYSKRNWIGWLENTTRWMCMHGRIWTRTGDKIPLCRYRKMINYLLVPRTYSEVSFRTDALEILFDSIL